MKNYNKNQYRSTITAVQTGKSKQALYFSVLRAISLALFGLLVIGFFSSKAFGAGNEDKKVVDYKFIIADIRSVEEYEAGHFEKSINVPPEKVDNFFKNINIAEDTIVLLYCRTGHRSGIAYKQAKSLGIKNIYDVGGLQEMKVLYAKLSQDKIFTANQLPTKS